ncbi:MAG: UDP-N-acetylmuramoyl-tripeptide--D-alanyl-D-alanine ligase [Candidatus Azobacteroides sp.]|nr:UDP-N-acetylmuramoyl-tripeptide--D-alanyl-D-alanine ligase [Candidatus Azobacteroides sp.]
MHTADLYSVFLKYPMVTTDSRNCPVGSLFFALKGEKFDGNDYIEQALHNGAAYAVGDRAELPQDSRIIRVENTLQALQDLASYHRKQLNLKVIAITGTNGKTTTKELVAAALSTCYSTLFTQGNLNNHIGVPLTLLRLKPEHRFAIIEMGANHPGEIRELCRIADPDFGLITNVGKAHLEGFGSFEGVVRTKTELYDYIREKKGSIFVNIDNPILKERSENTNRIFYGTSSEAFVQGRIIDSETGLEMEWRRKPGTMSRIKTQLVGNYNFENVLAAICVAMYWNVEEGKLNQALADYAPTNNRSQSLKTQRNHLIIDAYNANPSSMQVALDNFLNLKISPKMAILGEMKELGEYAPEEHQKLVDRLSESAIDKVILCGENFRNIRSNAPNQVIFRNTPELLDYLQSENFSGFHILIKGSRTNQLEKTIEFL